MEEYISVIVPVYNVEKYLEYCVKSIMEQTYKNLEIILVDDGSTDRSGKLCDRFAAMDDRIRVIHKENGGLSDARNAGLDIASGKYICFIDSDDYIKRNMIEALFQRLRAAEADMAICGYQRVDEQGNFIEAFCACESEIWTTEKFWKEMYGKYHILCVVAWNKLYRRELFETIRYKKGVTFEDEYVIDLLVEKCKSIAVIREALYMYRRRGGSIMANLTLNSEIDRIEFLADRAERLWKRGDQKFVEKTLHSNMMRMSEVSAKLASGSMGNPEEACRFNELKGRTDELLRQVCDGGASWWFRLNCSFFLRDMRFYGIWRKNYGRVRKIIRIGREGS